MIVFEITDKTGRRIHLTNERYQHISQDHPEVSNYLAGLEDTLINPNTISDYPYDESIKHYYKYYKYKKDKLKYLLVVVKYLNGEGFVITAYFVKRIK